MPEDFFKTWCSAKAKGNGAYRCEVLAEDATQRDAVRPLLTEIVQSHYVDPNTAKERLKRLGYKKAVKRLNTYLPQTSRARSGDLGEILATEYVNRRLPFRVPLFRLRWKDGRNMSLRGDDLIAVGEEHGKLQLLKGEVKSRRKLVSDTVRSAVSQLRRNANRPSAHTVNYVIDRLLELRKKKIADLLEGYMEEGISAKDLHHLLFTMSSNDPTRLFDRALGEYRGRVRISAVGLVVEEHHEFVKQTYRSVTWQPRVKSKGDSND
jgi:hypothetical protein